MTTILDRGAGDLGIKGNLILQLCEIGAQQVFGFPCHGEGFMFDPRIWNDRIDCCVEHAVKSVCKVVDEIRQSKPITPFAMSSWATADDKKKYLATKICCTESIVLGNENWTNALINPANPDADNPEDAFSTDFAAPQQTVGKSRIPNRIGTTRKNGGFLFLDANEEPLYPNLELATILTKQFGFELLLQVFETKMYVFIHRNPGAIVLLHKPLCISGDSRKFVPIDRSVLRAMTVEVLIRVAAHVRGESDLASDCPFCNGLQAAFAFESTHGGLHQFKMVASVQGREVMTPEDVSAIEKCKLAKANNVSDYPVARRNRAPFVGQGCGKDYESERPVDSSIVHRARCKLSFATSSDDLVDIVQEMDELFRSDSKLVSPRWAWFLDRFDDYCELKRELKNIRDKILLGSNRGNRTERLGHTHQDILLNGNKFLQIVNEVLHTKPGKQCFWIREFQATTIEERQQAPPPAELLYPGERILTGLAFEGFRTKLRDANMKNNTNSLKGARLEDGKKNITIQVMPGPKDKSRFQGFVRCHLVDHGENVMKKGNIRSHSQDDEAIIRSQFNEMLQLSANEYFWIREESAKNKEDLSRNVISSSELPRQCTSEPIFGHLARENVKTKLRRQKENLDRIVLLHNHLVTKKNPIPSRVKGFVRCYLVEPKAKK